MTELPSHCCVLRYYAVYLPNSERSQLGEGGCSQVGDGLMTGRIPNPRMAGVGHMVQGWRWKGMETVVQYVSRLGSALVEVSLLVLKKISDKTATLL